MSDKIIHIIAYQEKSLERLVKQIQEVLGPHITIKPTTLKEIHPEMVHANDIVFLSHPMIKGIVNKIIPPECPCIVAKRDINFASCRELINLPPGQKILVVNDTKKAIEEAVTSLRETIHEHDYYPYNPDETIPDDIDYILTPGEIDLVPDGFIKVINIGDRILDIETFIEFAELLGIDFQPLLVKRYMKSIVSLSLEYDGTDLIKENRIKDIRNVPQYTFDDVIAKSSSTVRGHKMNLIDVIKKIEAHGFLDESIEILKIFALGKHERTSFGRLTLKKRLEEAGIILSEQQLRMRMEILQELELLIVRQGRAGSTISRNGEEFLQFIEPTV
jgi:hypothetical protein